MKKKRKSKRKNPLMIPQQGQIAVPHELRPLNLALQKTRVAIETALNTLSMALDIYKNTYEEFVKLIKIYHLQEEAVAKQLEVENRKKGN